MSIKNTFKLEKKGAYNNVQKNNCFIDGLEFTISIVGIIILNFTTHPSIMHIYKNCITFSIIQQLLIFIVTTSYTFLHLHTTAYSSLQLLTSPYSLYTTLTASYSFLQCLAFSYNYILSRNRIGQHRYKARPQVKGLNEKKGIDFEEIFLL